MDDNRCMAWKICGALGTMGEACLDVHRTPEQLDAPGSEVAGLRVIVKLPAGVVPHHRCLVSILTLLARNDPKLQMEMAEIEDVARPVPEPTTPRDSPA